LPNFGNHKIGKTNKNKIPCHLFGYLNFQRTTESFQMGMSKMCSDSLEMGVSEM
jgi:hypothetical protein